MIYKGTTLQERFVCGRYTLAILLLGSVMLWMASLLFWRDDIACLRILSWQLPAWIDHILAFAIYIAVAFILNSFVIIEGRTPWLGGIFIFLTGLFPPLQNSATALATLAFMLILSLLFACYQREGIQRWVYSLFALLGFASLFVPQFLYLAPLFVVYMAMGSLLGFRNIFSAILGAATPFWLLFSAGCVWPQVASLMYPVTTWLGEQHIIVPSALSLFDIVLHLTELFVMLPAAVVLVRNTSPARPVMRRMLAFFIIMNFYLCALDFLCSGDAGLFLVWRLSGVAVMCAYLFTIKMTKLSNIYFILITILWGVIALIGLWNL